MSSINSKLGLKPVTRTRAATHSPNLVTNARCPTCGCRHVTEQQVHAITKRMCGRCGDVWEPTAEPSGKGVA